MTLQLVSCPHYANTPSERCGFPAEVQHRYVLESSDGPLESMKIRCVLGHWFNGPVEYLVPHGR